MVFNSIASGNYFDFLGDPLIQIFVWGTFLSILTIVVPIWWGNKLKDKK